MLNLHIEKSVEQSMTVLLIGDLIFDRPFSELLNALKQG
jgi:hypothetical protein